MGFDQTIFWLKMFRARWTATVASLLVFASLSHVPAMANPQTGDPLRAAESNQLARELAGTFIAATGNFQASPVSMRKNRGQHSFKLPVAVTAAIDRTIILVRHRVAETSGSQRECVAPTLSRGRAPPIS